MTWQDKIINGMRAIAEGCKESIPFVNCRICPFADYCDAIQVGAEAGFDVDIPESWDYESLSNNCS